ncbi:MAG TPA: hypothetical protein VFQ20_12070 [Burkholderiaceae bacterium]|nr:hypothetical protein [Burkholderiaceae bacterium]
MPAPVATRPPTPTPQSDPNRRTGADRRKIDKGPPRGRERRVSLEPRKPDVFERELTPSEWAVLQEQVSPPKKG